ncbi:hypothetical protein IAD21_05163 [Abditibacteriota bacterium]|nr:hypothetical protein IAD21_05163 [Abditibacteriota bacterium]
MVISTPLENICVESPFDFEETLKTLRENIAGAEMMVLHEIDTQAIIARAGIPSDGLRQLLYFHPRYMRRVLETNSAAVIEAPLKFVVRENFFGVSIHRISPRFLFGRYAGLDSLGEELEEVAAHVVRF